MSVCNDMNMVTSQRVWPSSGAGARLSNNTELAQCSPSVTAMPKPRASRPADTPNPSGVRRVSRRENRTASSGNGAGRRDNPQFPRGFAQSGHSGSARRWSARGRVTAGEALRQPCYTQSHAPATDATETARRYVHCSGVARRRPGKAHSARRHRLAWRGDARAPRGTCTRSAHRNADTTTS